jgi:hypothetical protein
MCHAARGARLDHVFPEAQNGAMVCTWVLPAGLPSVLLLCLACCCFA